MKRAFGSVPPLLTGLMLAFLLLPLWSLSFLPAPWWYFAYLPTLDAALLLFTYWVGPLVLAALIPLRSLGFLPLFYAECLALAVTVARHLAGGMDGGARYLQYAFILAMAGLGALLLNRDLYFPFLARRARAWRSASRVETQVQMRLEHADGRAINAMMEDCSANGLAVAGDRETLTELFGPRATGAPVGIALKIKGKPFKVQASVAWYADSAHLRRMGLRADDPQAMSCVLAELAGKSAGDAMPSRFAAALVSTSTYRAVLVVFAVAFGGSFLVPACGSSTGGAPVAKPGASSAEKATKSDEDEDDGKKKKKKKKLDDEEGNEDDDDDSGSSKSSGKGSGKGSGKASGSSSGSGSVSGGGGGDPTQDEACDFLNGIPDAGKLGSEISYLCADGKFDSLMKESNGQMVQVEDKNQGGISTFSFGSAARLKGTIDGMLKIGDTFCTGFAQYKALLGEEPFAKVESITPSNKSKNGCDYRFLGAKVFLFQPSYFGVQRTYVNEQKTIVVSANYLTQEESLVKDSVNLSVARKIGDMVEVYAIQMSASDTKGFHSQAKSEIQAGFNAGFSATARALQKLSQ